ncbi:MAG TPA: pilus assembly protein TadG-related protein, partial [Acetobacteraceae bacterium]|nr:pilus assembly protein TadG-related protein [Acetobacteraceae bacterium]
MRLRLGTLGALAKATEGAVAPTIALSLFGLLAAGGIAFDYSRMASLDTELQDAADHAALAAASQLDGRPNACARARSAATSLVTNGTRFANDGKGSPITITSGSGCGVSSGIPDGILLYQDNAKTIAATSDANAHFVQVTVNTRTANFALTPVVSVFSSGALSATAFAGVASSICLVPPVMICNPQETGTNTSFNVSGLVGAGLRLVSVGNGGSWAPGNFGYLDTGAGSGASVLREVLGWSVPPGDCVPTTGVTTKPGATTTVTDALNTRFDIYNQGQSCPSGGTCPASSNSTKDVVRKNGNGKNSCTLGPQGWQVSTKPYLPSSATTPLTLAQAQGVDSIGYPRDMCHAVSSTGSCAAGKVGDGVWDRNAYFYVNYGWGNASYGGSPTWQTLTGLGASTTRYQAYQWELAHAGQTVGGKKILDPAGRAVAGGNTSYAPAVCASSVITPGPTNVDRR